MNDTGTVYVDIAPPRAEARWEASPHKARIDGLDATAEKLVITDDYSLALELLSRSWQVVQDGSDYECTRSQSDAGTAQHRLWQQIGESA